MTPKVSIPDPATLQAFAREWFAGNASVLTLDEAEQAVQTLSRLAAQAMMEAAMGQLAGKATYEGTTIPCECGARAAFKGYRRRFVQTLCGEVEVTRAYYYCAGCGKGHLPWDATQGLNQRQFSPGLKAMACRVCGRLHYREAATLIEELTGLRIEESSLEDIVAEVGSRARQEDDARIEGHFSGSQPIAARTAPKRLYVATDAGKAHIDGSWHDVKTGVVFEGKAAGRGDHPERDTKVGGHYIARQETAEVFGRRLYIAALGEGLKQATDVVVLGDGADWIWNLADMHFPGYIGIVDYWHACEHIHDLAKVLYGEESLCGQRWAKEHCETLEKEGPARLIRALKRRKPKTAKQKEAVRLELGYFQKNRGRMHYPSYRARGMMIGSGPAEAACKVIVNLRLKQAGMRWSGAGSDAILATRALLVSKAYDELLELAHAA